MVHLKTCLLPEASLDAGSFTGWGAWFADTIIKTSIARCLRHTEGDSPCCTDTSADITADSPAKVFGREGCGEGEPFSKKVALPASCSFFTSPGVCLPSPKQKIPGGAGIKKDPLALRAARGSQTIFGSGLLSHMTLCSIIGDGELNFRVRNGVGCTLSSMATKEIWQIY